MQLYDYFDKKSDLDSFITEFSFIKNDLVGGKSIKDLADKSSYKLRHLEIIERMLSSYESITNMDKISQLSADIESQLSDLTVVKITLPFDPSVNFVQRVLDEFRAHPVLSKSLVDVRENTALFGGCVIEYMGNLYDYSIAASIRRNIRKGNEGA